MSRGREADRAAVDELAGVSRILSWLFLLGFMLLMGVARGVYAAHGIEPSERFEALGMLGGLTFLWYWIKNEGHPGGSYPLDFGWFVAMVGPFLAGYYFWRGQRWRGIGKVLLLGIAYLTTYLITFLTEFLLS